MRIRRVPSAAVVAGAAVILGVIGGSITAEMQERVNARYRVYTAALAAIEADYVEPLVDRCAAPDVCGTEALVYESIEGMLSTLDPHSSFFTPRGFAQMRERQEGRYFGIGISIVEQPPNSGVIVVTALFEGSPAYRAGIRRGDVIARVGSEVVKDWRTDDVVKRVKGPKGTTVDIGIRRPGLESEIALTVERDEIRIPTVRTAFMAAPGTGYIRLQDFSETTNAELGDALTKLKTAGMERLVLDLRDNPGGPLDQAIAVSNRFLRQGQPIVSTRGRIPNSNEEYRANVRGGYTDVPLVVLINRGSASASEIVGGAMQDHDRAILVGETTFGKALVQSVYPIANGAGLALTTGRYYTPSGRMIQRPWDSSFDEYLTYSQRDQDPARARSASDLRYTDGSRKVYSGGGVEPDHFIPGPVEGFNPSRFSRALYSRALFVGFAERFTREGDVRPGARSAASYRVAPGWALTDAMVGDFRKYLDELRVRMDETAYAADLPFIKAMIHYEVDVDLFGVEEARKAIAKVDPQLQAALGYFGEASQLLATSVASGARTGSGAPAAPAGPSDRR
jgi:carboxyl-terminal processing protease